MSTIIFRPIRCHRRAQSDTVTLWNLEHSIKTLEIALQSSVVHFLESCILFKRMRAINSRESCRHSHTHIHKTMATLKKSNNNDPCYIQSYHNAAPSQYGGPITSHSSQLTIYLEGRSMQTRYLQISNCVLPFAFTFPLTKDGHNQDFNLT